MLLSKPDRKLTVRSTMGQHTATGPYTVQRTWYYITSSSNYHYQSSTYMGYYGIARTQWNYSL